MNVHALATTRSMGAPALAYTSFKLIISGCLWWQRLEGMKRVERRSEGSYGVEGYVRLVLGASLEGSWSSPSFSKVAEEFIERGRTDSGFMKRAS